MRGAVWMGALVVSILAACSVSDPKSNTDDGDVDPTIGLGDGGSGAADAQEAHASSESGPPSTDGASEDAITSATDADVDGGLDASTHADAVADAPHEAAPCTITSCGAESVCTSGVCVTARRVFVSSGTFLGDLGGYSGADTTCQQIATGAMLGGTWMAWISDSASSPSMRFNQSTHRYALLDGTVVASDWTALTSGALQNAIGLDEHGAGAVNGGSEVWTATNPDGTLQADGCNSFSTSSHSGPTVAVGILGLSNTDWSDIYLQFCDRTEHLYCFEQ